MSTEAASTGDARAALLRRWLARASSTTAPELVPDLGPIDPPGPALIGIWQEVLGHADIGPDDDYFALGGDSIAAVAVVSRSTAAGISLTTHDLFELRTVRAIVDAQLTDRPTNHGSGGPPAPRLGLTPLQRGILFQSLADPTGRTQVVQVSARLEGDVDPGELARACRAVVARHPALRASIHWDASGSWRVVHDAVSVPVHAVDLRLRDAQDRAAAVTDHLERMLADGFELGTAPLLRFSLLRLEDRVLRFVLTHHHLVLDGWSQQLVLRDLLDIYDGAVPTSPSCDPAREHLAWLDEHDQSTGLARWSEILADFVPAQVSPDPVGDADHAHRPAVTRAVDLGGVAGPAAGLGVTPATVVYGAWSVVVGALAGTDDVAIGTTLAGRAGVPGSAEHVGMFIATLPLRTRLHAADEVRTWVRGVQEDRAEIDILQHCSLADIARCAPGPASTGGVRSLFDTIAVVENFPEYVGEGTRSRRIAVTDVAGSVWEGYPLVLEARLGDHASALLRADATLFSEPWVTTILSAFAAVVHRILDAAPATVGDLRATARTHLAPAGAMGGQSVRSARRQVAGAQVADSSSEARL